MAGNRRNFTYKQRSAIEGLLEGKTVSAVADSVGVSERTLYRWLAEERFTSELRRAELRVLDAVGLRLVNLAGAAVDALETVLNEPSVRGASVKRLTAKDILELLLKWRSEIILEERIVNLERQVFHGKK